MKLSELVQKLKLIQKNNPERFNKIINNYKINNPELYNKLKPYFPEYVSSGSGFKLDISKAKYDEGFNWNILLIFGLVLIFSGLGYFLYSQGVFDGFFEKEASGNGGFIVDYTNQTQNDGVEQVQDDIEFVADCYPNSVYLNIYVYDDEEHSFEYYVRVRDDDEVVFDSGLSDEEPYYSSESFQIIQPISGQNLTVGKQYSVITEIDGDSYSDDCVCMSGGG